MTSNNNNDNNKNENEGTANNRDRPASPLSALPSPLARVLAFAAILVGGACGALIGYGVMKAQCTSGSCRTGKSVGAVVGGLFVAIGVAVIAVLVLRAMGEWRTARRDG